MYFICGISQKQRLQIIETSSRFCFLPESSIRVITIINMYYFLQSKAMQMDFLQNGGSLGSLGAFMSKMKSVE